MRKKSDRNSIELNFIETDIRNWRKYTTEYEVILSEILYFYQSAHYGA